MYGTFCGSIHHDRRDPETCGADGTAEVSVESNAQPWDQCAIPRQPTKYGVSILRVGSAVAKERDAMR